ncbi:MAG: VWA domain-containing protein [Candidatus Hydrogenedentes bacterium]|nr:VWA domain-containing protein [Candidatus Hydrogenedentota bacterium]
MNSPVAPAPPPAPARMKTVYPVSQESYERIEESGFQPADTRPLSTFAVDVDRASYANVRRFLTGGALPPIDAVRVEELINYFTYALPPITGEDPIAAYVEVSECPWQSRHRLALVALHARDVDMRERKPANIVFLLDCSGSMADVDKLPLLKEAMKLLVRNLDARDSVAVVTYKDEARRHLRSTRCDDKGGILAAIDELEAGGSTNGADGLRMAYDEARRHFDADELNRVILATDGDFNVGTTDRGDLVELIQREAKSGVFLTVLGMGTGNLKDSNLEAIADKGNGIYAYIDSFNEAHRVLVSQMSGALVTLAKDVKIQVEFNPAKVVAYRLIGYENRALAARDFNDDRKDAGEMGPGQSVIALYEIVPAGEKAPEGSIDALKYQTVSEGGPTLSRRTSNELMTVKWRFKHPDGEESVKREIAVVDGGTKLDRATNEFKFASAVAGFGMLLRNSQHIDGYSFRDVERLGRQGQGTDSDGYRGEFIALVAKADGLR